MQRFKVLDSIRRNKLNGNSFFIAITMLIFFGIAINSFMSLFFSELIISLNIHEIYLLLLVSAITIITIIFGYKHLWAYFVAYLIIVIASGLLITSILPKYSITATVYSIIATIVVLALVPLCARIPNFITIATVFIIITVILIQLGLFSKQLMCALMLFVFLPYMTIVFEKIKNTPHALDNAIMLSVYSYFLISLFFTISYSFTA